jgi:elongation factor P
MYATSDFRNGLRIEIDGEPFVIVEFQHVKPGKGNAFTRTKIKSLITGRVWERTLKSGDRVGKPDIEEKTMQYLYKEDEKYYFMDTTSYEQLFINVEQLGEAVNYLVENIEVSALIYNGRSIGVDLPNVVELKVVRTDPGVKGDTASGGSKPAELETGYVLQVPLYLEEGEVIRVDTRTGEFKGRAN